MTDQILKLLGNKRGYDVLRNPLLNKGSAFTPVERVKLGLDGILPPQFNDMAMQAQRSYEGIRRHTAPIDQYVALAALQDRNEHLFYRVVRDHIEEFMPIIYTPTVGQATRDFSHVFQHSRGVWITPASRGHIATALRNAAGERRIRLMVVTDNESILGIGDQGAGGIGISIGKLSLYTAAAGVHPAETLPISIDVGTDNKALLDDPLYLGRRHPRLRGAEYDALIDEFVLSVKSEFPGALLQWEDFRKENALTIMNKYRKVLPSFNDDIQGTGAVALAGLLGACRVIGHKLSDERIVVFGAGAGGLGIARQIRAGLVQLGFDDTAIRQRIAVLDSRGLIVSDNEMRDAYKSELAWSQEQAQRVGLGNAAQRSLDDVVDHFKPTVLIGASGQPGSFPEALIRRVAALVERPIIFPLSNPNDNTEARPEDIVRWTDGRAIVAAGSPFQPVAYGGELRKIGQANNAFIFPGLGLGALLAEVREVTDNMINVAAASLAGCLTEAEIAEGLLFPSVRRLRDVARGVAIAVIKQAAIDGVATKAIADPEAVVAANMWEPEYPIYA
ncbi:MAG TPA: NAD-dependent malic enzyme [Pseudomonadales bacterium]|jgi:malate dehydrogenase (oxaloacetate-decarboxylating)|nr:NAD-dependent malic enzyme [Pseudomonadales bacterium]